MILITIAGRGQPSSSKAHSAGARLHAAAARLARMWSERQPRPWYLLDDRMLADIGMSPLDAEIARLDAGVGQTIATDPLAEHGLSGAELTRWLRSGRRSL